MSHPCTTKHPIVGTVRWAPLSPVKSGGAIRLWDGWALQNIRKVFVPQLVGVRTYGGRFNGWVQWYKPAAEQLKRAWVEVAEQNLLDRVLFWGGSFVPRLVRGSTRTPSDHAFGTAFDINPQQNGMHVTPPAIGAEGSVRGLVPIFERHGFGWGGDYRRRPDGMHFEVRELIDVQGKPVKLEMDGKELDDGCLVGGETWVPLRVVAEAAGLKVNWRGGKPPKVELERGE